jgi:hypothetical protein
LTWGKDAQRDTGSALTVKRTANRSEPAEAGGSLVLLCNRGLHNNYTFGPEQLAGAIEKRAGKSKCIQQKRIP